jgi:hypothetical protein
VHPTSTETPVEPANNAALVVPGVRWTVLHSFSAWSVKHHGC